MFGVANIWAIVDNQRLSLLACMFVYVGRQSSWYSEMWGNVAADPTLQNNSF